MKLAIYWGNILFYHTVRLKELFKLAEISGYEVDAFVLSPKYAELPVYGYQELLSGQIKVLSNDYKNSGTYSWKSKQQIIKYLDNSKPDVVAIIGYDGKVARSALGWCRFNKKAAILMFSSQEKDIKRSKWKESIKSILVKCYDASIVGGSSAGNYVLKLGMSKERIFHGYESVDNEFWENCAKKVRNNPEYFRKHSVISIPEYYFLSVGRFIRKKNFDGLIRAYSKYVIQTKEDPWPLVIVGDGELKLDLYDLVKSLNLSSLVYFPGYLEPDDLAPLYGLATVFILPSIINEQWGLVVNEAMAAGLPAIVSNTCGCAPDLVIEGETGFTYDPSDEQRLIELLSLISNGTIDLDEMGRKANRHINDFHSPIIFANELINAAQVAIKYANMRRRSIWPSPWLWP